MNLLSNRFFAALFLIFTTVSVAAQIPQNIEVEGEATGFWDYVLYTAVLIVVGIVVMVVLKLIKRK